MPPRRTSQHTNGSRRANIRSSKPLASRPFASPETTEIVSLSHKSPITENRLTNIPVLNPDPNHRLPLQPKLTIGAVGDKYEQEADRVAKQVVQQISFAGKEQSATGKAMPTQPQNTLQREAMPEEDALQIQQDGQAINRSIQPTTEQQSLQTHDPSQPLRLSHSAGASVVQREGGDGSTGTPTNNPITVPRVIATLGLGGYSAIVGQAFQQYPGYQRDFGGILKNFRAVRSAPMPIKIASVVSIAAMAGLNSVANTISRDELVSSFVNKRE